MTWTKVSTELGVDHFRLKEVGGFHHYQLRRAHRILGADEGSKEFVVLYTDDRLIYVYTE